jgi:hypothetical protein
MQLIRDSSHSLKCKRRRIELVFLGPKLGYDIIYQNIDSRHGMDVLIITFCIQT